MLNPALEVSRWARELAGRGRVQVPALLEPAAAERLHDLLSRQVPWQLALRTGRGPRAVASDDYAAMDAGQRRELLREAAQQAGAGFAFAYESYQMIPAYLEQRDPGLPLHRLTEYLNSPAFLAFTRELTGEARIRKVDCQATCYRPGHFLTRHDDREESEGRLYAYVLGFTRRWQADWGGLLQFLDGSGRVLETFLPRFNALSVFRVPAFHCVSLVAPWAAEPRLSITGWFRSA